MNLTDFGPDSGGRVKRVVEIKKIVYGNNAKAFGKKREEDSHTHNWTVYVKPFNNEDMSAYVKKIHFKLHESYANPNRILTKAPYEVNESGWGEFEIVIKIYFHDPTERPVTIYHILKLFQSPISVDANNPDSQQPNSIVTAPPLASIIDTKKFLVSEYYDEIVFQEPTQLMQQLLNNVQPISSGSWTHDTDFEEKKTSALSNIIETKGKVKAEINTLKDKLKLAREKIAELKNQLAIVTQN